MTIAVPPVTIRRVRDGDEAAIARLLGDLDVDAQYRRWFTGGVDLGRAIDWAAHPAGYHGAGLLAFAGEEPVGHAALAPADAGRAEIAFEVAAPWRRHGIAGALLEELLSIAARRGLREVYADVLPQNADMLAVLREHGPHAEAFVDGVLVLTVPIPTEPGDP